MTCRNIRHIYPLDGLLRGLLNCNTRKLEINSSEDMTLLLHIDQFLYLIILGAIGINIIFYKTKRVSSRTVLKIVWYVDKL